MYCVALTLKVEIMYTLTVGLSVYRTWQVHACVRFQKIICLFLLEKGTCMFLDMRDLVHFSIL